MHEREKNMKKKIIFLIFMCVLFLTSCKGSVTQTEKKKIYGVWIATTARLDFPSAAGLEKEEIEAEIASILDVCTECRINTVFLQVRGNADALYNGSVFGASAALYDSRTPKKEISVDVLDAFINAAHRKGIELYAWVNPYRIGSGEADEVIAALPPEHPARHTSILRYESGVCFDPGDPETTELVLTGLREIVENHAVDGIVFDDYFYPYDNTYNDNATYRKYGAGFKSIGDFRRYSVDRMIARCSEYLRGQDVIFGVSPFGIWRNKKEDALGSDTDGLSAYDEIFADSRCWVKQGWLDLVIPQIYWSFENKKAPFGTVYDWWASLCEKYDCDLAISHYVSRVGSNLAGWESMEQIERQLTFLENDGRCTGSVFFRMGDLMSNKKGERGSVSKSVKDKL